MPQKGRAFCPPFFWYNPRENIPQGEADPSSRKKDPEFFCHKYAYIQDTLKKELESVGFRDVITRQDGTNFVVTATKPVPSFHLLD